MRAVNRLLVGGGGIAGLCAAIELCQRGIAVDRVEVEVDPEWRVHGAGLTLSGPTPRALRTVGVLDEVMSQGATWHGLDLCDADGRQTMHLPPTGALMRPVFARILAGATRACGAEVRLGTTRSPRSRRTRTACTCVSAMAATPAATSSWRPTS